MPDKKIIAGLRIDVDTFRGTRDGVPQLLTILKKHNIQASFFFSVGPDNMGRHLWRLLKPAFLIKMLRSNAASLYGWDILLRGTFWPGPNIAKKLAHAIENTQTAGHEVGLHAWDHQHWQKNIHKMSAGQIYQDIAKGVGAIKDITTSPPCSAAAGWQANTQVLLEKNKFNFCYNSDCRGSNIFRPMINDTECTPQIPVTLPTYDEIIGQQGVNKKNYNDTILQLIKPNQLNTLTIHAEAEGISCADMFDDFLIQAKQKNIQFVPLIQLLPKDITSLPFDTIKQAPLPGREGSVCYQASTYNL